MSATQSVILTREDAVKTQLDTAIWLWFIEEQIGPIHALADNALTILNDIGGKMGKESQLYSKAMHEVHGRDRLKGFSNFLKHGSKDANAAYKFPLLWDRGVDAGCHKPMREDFSSGFSAYGNVYRSYYVYTLGRWPP